MKKVPVNIISGFLGSGKTTVILHCVQQLSQGHKVVWLKNEYGNMNIDSLLAKEAGVTSTEILNGCICCTAVGKLDVAIDEILEKYEPERILIETAGTAHPASLVLALGLKNTIIVDSVTEIIDAENFSGYSNKSSAMESQKQFVDLIVINKTNKVDPRVLEQRLDDVYEIYPDTPKYFTADGFVPISMIFSAQKPEEIAKTSLKRSDDIYKGYIAQTAHEHEHNNHADNPELFYFSAEKEKLFSKSKLEKVLKDIAARFIRVKGVFHCEAGFFLLNQSYTRSTWTQLVEYQGDTQAVFMGKNIQVFEEEVKKLLSAC